MSAKHQSLLSIGDIKEVTEAEGRALMEEARADRENSSHGCLHSQGTQRRKKTRACGNYNCTRQRRCLV